MTTGSPARVSRHHFRIAVVTASVVAAAVGSVLLATRDSGEKVTTVGVTATLPVPGHPGSLVAGRDAIWVALTDARPPVRDRPLLRIDLASSTVQHTILLGGQVSSLVHDGKRLLASLEHVGGDGSGPSLVVAVDWTSGDVLVRRQFPETVGPLALAGDNLWALEARSGTLLRLDPDTLLRTAPPLQLSSGRTLGLTVGEGYVWAIATDTGEVVRVDPATSAITRAHVGGSPRGLAVAAGNVWFANRDRGEIGRLDVQTLRSAGPPIHVGTDPAWMASAGRFLLVGDTDGGTVTRIDLRSGETAGPPIRIAEAAKDAPDFAIAPLGTSVWVSSFASETLTRVSATPSASAVAVTASSAAVTSTAMAALPHGGKVVASIAVPPGGGAFTAGEGAVWSMNNDTSTLLRIDPEQNAVVARIKVDPSEAAVAGEGALWLSHTHEDTVSRVDPETNEEIATIHVGQSPGGIAVSHGAVWVANGLEPSVSRIDPATNRVVATIRVGPDLECCAEHPGVLVAGNAVWATVPNGNKLVRIDPSTNALVETVKLPFAPCGFVAADTGALWSAGGGCADIVARFDLRSRALTKLGEPHPVGLALAFDTLWVAVLGSGNVDQIDPSTNRLVARLHVGGTPVRLVTGFGSVWVNDDEGHVLRIDPGS